MDTAMRASGSIAWTRRWRRASGIIAAIVAITWTRGRSLRRSLPVCRCGSRCAIENFPRPSHQGVPTTRIATISLRGARRPRGWG
jgi:hypothetical protein